MKDLETTLQALGLPERDPLDLPDSPLRFPDNGHYRIEISGIERLSALETLVHEADTAELPIHRIIATVGGATYLPRAELEAFAALAREQRYEVVITLGPRRAWDAGRQINTEEGLVSGMRLRGMTGAKQWFADLERCLEAGFRGFLVPDEGLLWLGNELRRRGVLPPETIFKLSVFAGHANPAGARVVENLGADTFNPLADLTLPMLAGIRQAVTMPLDVYMSLVQTMGGFVRFYEAAEIARVAAPCYFKFEPGPSEESMYAPWNSPASHDAHVRERVREATVVRELIDRENPELRCSPTSGEDLVIPRPAGAF